MLSGERIYINRDEAVEIDDEIVLRAPFDTPEMERALRIVPFDLLVRGAAQLPRNETFQSADIHALRNGQCFFFHVAPARDELLRHRIVEFNCDEVASGKSVFRIFLSPDVLEDLCASAAYLFQETNQHHEMLAFIAEMFVQAALIESATAHRQRISKEFSDFGIIGFMDIAKIESGELGKSSLFQRANLQITEYTGFREPKYGDKDFLTVRGRKNVVDYYLRKCRRVFILEDIALVSNKTVQRVSVSRADVDGGLMIEVELKESDRHDALSAQPDFQSSSSEPSPPKRRSARRKGDSTFKQVKLLLHEETIPLVNNAVGDGNRNAWIEEAIREKLARQLKK